MPNCPKPRQWQIGIFPTLEVGQNGGGESGGAGASMALMPKAPFRTQGGPAAYIEGVGQRLAWFREVVGWTQVQLARAAGVDQSTWAKWEAGKRLASVSHVARLCDPLGLSLDYVYRGKIGGLLRRDVELLLVAQHPELVLQDQAAANSRAKVAVPAV